MAIAVDGSTPARWAASLSDGGSQASASFTAPADALLVACLCYDGNDDGYGGTPGISDSGGLSWTQRVIRTLSESTAGGGSVLWTARTTSSTSRTVSVSRTGGSHGLGLRYSCKVYVLTGVDVDGTPVDTVGASNEGGTNTDPTDTSSITPGANGLHFVCATDWSANTSVTSSNLTGDVTNYLGEITAFSGYQTSTSGVGITGNLNPTGTPQFKWAQITVREAGGGGGGGGGAAPHPDGGPDGALMMWEQCGVF